MQWHRITLQAALARVGSLPPTQLVGQTSDE
jgi:hypothetical protein